MIRRTFLASIAALPIFGKLGLTKPEKPFEYKHKLIGKEINHYTGQWFGNAQYFIYKDKPHLAFPLHVQLELYTYYKQCLITYYCTTLNLPLDIAKKIQNMKTKDICDKMGWYDRWGKKVAYEEESDGKYLDHPDVKPEYFYLFGQKFILSQVNYGA